MHFSIKETTSNDMYYILKKYYSPLVFSIFFLTSEWRSCLRLHLCKFHWISDWSLYLDVRKRSSFYALRFFFKCYIIKVRILLLSCSQKKPHLCKMLLSQSCLMLAFLKKAISNYVINKLKIYAWHNDPVI